MVSITPRYAHAEQCALLALLIVPQLAMMGLDDRSTDRQSHTHAVLLARLVRFKQRASHSWIDSRPIIGNRHLD